jgi:hypothetical protein
MSNKLDWSSADTKNSRFPHGNILPRSATSAAMTDDELRHALNSFLEKRPELGGATGWAVKAGLGRGTLHSFLSPGKRQSPSLKMSSLHALAVSAGVTIFDIIGTGPKRPSGMVQVPFLSIATELGGRVVTGIDKTQRPMLMPRAWLERYAFGEQGRVFLWKMKMPYDEGHVGDLVAIDLRASNPRRQPGNYAMVTDGTLMVRRVHPLPGDMLRMVAEGAPFDATASQVNIIGRAVWRSGGI